MPAAQSINHNVEQLPPISVNARSQSCFYSRFDLPNMHGLESPFEKSHELLDAASGSPPQLVPGQPMISPTCGPYDIYAYLNGDLLTLDLDTMAPHLWLMSTPSHANISPLHHQIVKGRKILLTEDPRLHLTWIDDRIFVKPLPLYLASYDFWLQNLLPQAISRASLDQKPSNATPSEYEVQKQRLVASALGFLRSYSHLIRHHSDFDLAMQARLLPPSTTFESFCAFSRRFRDITDTDVCSRYHYGELRLSRLNFWAKILLGRWDYIKIHHQYWQYFQRFYGPLLFLFGFLSVALSAMQVELNAEGFAVNKWSGFWTFSRVFSIFTLVLLALTGLLFSILLSRKLLLELVFAITHRWR